MSKGKGITLKDAGATAVLLVALVAIVAGIGGALNYLKPSTSENPSTSEPVNPGGPPILPDLSIYIMVDGELSDGYIEFEQVDDSKVFEFRNKSDNQFYEKKITIQTAKPESFQITDMNGDDLYVRTRVTMTKEEYAPVKLYVMSEDFIFYVLLNLKPNPATSISIDDITFID